MIDGIASLVFIWCMFYLHRDYLAGRKSVFPKLDPLFPPSSKDSA